MVEFEKVFEPEKGIEKENELFKAVKEVSEKIGESTGTSTFITVEDALNSGSKIFLIEDKPLSNEEIQRDFIPL